MATIQSRSELMFVPTPTEVIGALAGMLNVQPGCVALDPCCGDGLMARSLVGPAAKLYGIELELGRARQARRHCSEVVQTSAQEARISHDSFGLIFCNPPYDDSVHGRLELAFLERMTPWLAPGGVLIYVIKQARYTPHIIKHLARFYQDFRHWRFPDPFYSGPALAFGQTVLLARKCPQQTRGTVDARTFGQTTLMLETLRPLPASGGERYLVPVGRRPELFSAGTLSDDAIFELVSSSPIERAPRMSRLDWESPPLPLTDGHLSLVLASGAVDGVLGEGADLHVTKGTVLRTVTEEVEHKETSHGNPLMEKRKIESFRIVIRALMAADGTIHNVSGDSVRIATEEDDDADD